MIVYNPNNLIFLKDRLKEAQDLLNQIPIKHCFITGSFLYKEKYNDIDIFIVSRTKRKFKINNKKARITIIDFNDLYSLFYHSISKSCIAKNFLPVKPLKVTLSDYWGVINEAIPTLFNQKSKFHKNTRFLILYTEYFNNGIVFDTFQLDEKINKFKNYKEIMNYVKDNAPKIFVKRMKNYYLRRFFYTQAGHYKDLLEYSSQKFLYNLTHQVTKRGLTYG